MVGQPEAWTAITAVLALVVTLGSTGIRVAVLMARLTDSVKALNVSMEKMTAHIGDHEMRISRLEDRKARRGGRGTDHETRITSLEQD